MARTLPSSSPSIFSIAAAVAQTLCECVQTVMPSSPASAIAADVPIEPCIW
jgi:hypothetical protein